MFNNLKSWFRTALAVLICLVNKSFWAQTTTITVGGITPNFTQLSQAFNAINTGFYPGTVYIKINGNTNETVKATLSQNALVDSVMIYPTTAAVIQGNLADNLVELNGADFVHFDGRINRAGSVSSLTIMNTYTANYTFSFKNSATNNFLKYLTLKNSGPGVIIFENAASGAGNTDNTIEKCFIGDGAATPRYGIYSVGAFNVLNYRNKILNNDIYNCYSTSNNSAGIYLYDYCSNWEINGNSFYQTANRTSSYLNTAIKIFPNNTSYLYKHKILNNYMGGSADSCGGIPFTINSFNGIEFMGASDTLSLILNNKIRNMDIPGSFRGILLSYGKVLAQDNSIGDTVGTGSLKFTALGAPSQTVYGIIASMNDSVNIVNNYIGAITASCSVTGIEVYQQSGTSKVSVTGNLIGSRTTANNINVAASGTCAIIGIRHSITNGIVNKNTIMNLTASNVSGGNCSMEGIFNSSGYTSDNHIGYLKSVTQGLTYAGGRGILSFEAKNNFVHHLDFTSAYYTVVGVQAYTAVNNIISLGFGINSAAQFFGLYGDNGVNAGYFHNTVCLGGVGSSNYLSACMYGGTLLKDNIFYSVRTSTISSPGINYCLYSPGTSVANCFYVTGPVNAVAWSGGITYSNWGSGGAYVNPMLSNIGSPLAFSYKPNVVLNGTNSYGGFVSSVPTDYFGFSRPNPPTMGAIEKTTCVTVPHTKNVSACTSYSVGSQVYTLTGTYNQTLTYPGGCDTLLTLNLQLGPPVPTLAASSSTVCAGQSTTLSAFGAASYTWSAPSSPTTAVIVVNPNVTTVYTVAASNSLACTGNYTIMVAVNPLPAVNVNSGQVCSGDSFAFSPSGASTYTYINGGPVITPSSSANYSVAGTDTNGCVAGISVQIIVNPLPVLSVNSGSVCTGSVYTLTPSGAVNYSFSMGPQLSPVANTTVTIIGSDANGCVQTTTATIIVLPLPTVAVSGGSVCSGNSFTLQPSGGITYTYQNGGPQVFPLTTSVYGVNSIDANGCQSASSATVQVVVVQSPAVNIAASATLACVGQVFTLTANGASSYTWSTGSITPTLQLSPSVGIYTLTLYGNDNTTGCSDSADVTVTVDACTAINEFNQVEFTIFPNPSHGVLNINSLTGGTVNIYDISGRLVLRQEVQQGSTTLSLVNYAKGMYVISFIKNNFTWNKHFVNE